MMPGSWAWISGFALAVIAPSIGGVSHQLLAAVMGLRQSWACRCYALAAVRDTNRLFFNQVKSLS